MRDYSKDIIKKYKYWRVSVFENQEYLGRCVIWCERADACDLADATAEELLEFSKIIKELKTAIYKSFTFDWINYSFLGNEIKHLHCLVVPRYKNEREFNGQIFKDPRWGYNWLLDESIITSEEMIEAVKQKIKENIIED